MDINMNIERIKYVIYFKKIVKNFYNIFYIFLLFPLDFWSSILASEIVTGFFSQVSFAFTEFIIGKKKDWSLKVWDYVENEESEIVPVILRCEVYCYDWPGCTESSIVRQNGGNFCGFRYVVDGVRSVD